MIYSASLDKIYNFNVKDLSSTIYALAQLGIKPDQIWLIGWYISTQRQLHHFNEKHLTHIIYALNKLGLKPNTSWLTEWFVNAENNIDSFNAQGLSNSIYALSRLGIKFDQSWLKAWIIAAKDQLHYFNAQNLINSMYAFILNEQKIPQFLTDEIFKTIDPNSINIQGSNQIFIIKFIDQDLYQEHKMFFKQIEQRLHKLHKLEQSNVSYLHKQISSLLVKLGEKHSNEKLIKELYINVDIFVPKRNLVIQIDGPSHYIDNNEILRLNVNSNLNSKLLQKQGYNVIRISYLHADKYCNHEQDAVDRMKILLRKYPNLAASNAQTQYPAKRVRVDDLTKGNIAKKGKNMGKEEMSENVATDFIINNIATKPLTNERTLF